MTERGIIVNADDYAMSPGVSAGILQAYRAGAIHRASAMANMGSFSDAAAQAVTEPGLLVGVHGTLTCGPPVSDISLVPTLVNGAGEFRPLGDFVKTYSLGRIAGAEVELEIDAQIRKFKTAGLSPAHLDSHHHLHYLPKLSGIFFALALRHGIPYVRWGAPCPDEAPSPGVLFSGAGLRAWSRHRAIARFQRRMKLPSGLVSTRFLLGLINAKPGGYASAVSDSLRAAEAPFAELVCHPGCIDGELLRVDPGTPPRDEELRAYLDPRILQLISNARR